MEEGEGVSAVPFKSLLAGVPRCPQGGSNPTYVGWSSRWLAERQGLGPAEISTLQESGPL